MKFPNFTPSGISPTPSHQTIFATIAFVDFEFPDEHGKPYKSNGGKMVWCEELEKEIPEGWEVGNFQNDLIFKTGKLDSNASVNNGKYPFFTCSEEVFKVDSYSFEQEAVLLEVIMLLENFL